MAEFVDFKTNENNPGDDPSSSDHEYFLAIYEQIDKVVNHNTNLSNEQAERCKQRFREIFESFHAQKNEYEALDDAVKEIAEIRKTYPLSIRKAFTTILTQQNIALSTRTIQGEPSTLSPEPVINLQPELLPLLSDIKNTTSSLSQNATSTREKVERLKEAIVIDNSHKVHKSSIIECSSPHRKRQKTQMNNSLFDGLDDMHIETN